MAASLEGLVPDGLMHLPLLVDFAVRLACGLALALLVAPWKLIPPAFFRTLCHVILGLFVLAALGLAQSGLAARPDMGFTVAIAAAILSYFASIAWGLGMPRLGLPLLVLIAFGGGVILVNVSRGGSGDMVWYQNAAGRLSSALLLGSTLSAMLLGHHYLTAPAMSIDPLRRYVRASGLAVALRSIVAALGLILWQRGGGLATSMVYVSGLFLAVRWGIGIVGTAVAMFLAWKTVQIRSTQSATGILYVAMTLVLFGELSAMILGRDVGVAL